MFTKYHLTVIALFSLYIPLQAQSGWAQEKGSLYTQAAVSYYSSNQFYGTQGQLFAGENTFSNASLNFYGEYGITNQLTAIADIPVLRSNQFSNTESVLGLGDLRLGLKYQLTKAFPIALSIAAEIPTNDGIQFAFTNELNELGVRERINLPTSDGEFNIWSTLAISQSFAGGKAYGSLYGQVNFRTQDFSNQLKIGGELGYKVIPPLYLMARLSIQERLSDAITPGASFLYGEGTTFTSIGVSAFYELNEQLRLVLSFADYNGWLTDLRNIYDGNTYSVGIALEL
ncbi:MAG: hypothetical protein AB8G22_05120 [Saprospiraceae bacterium]